MRRLAAGVAAAWYELLLTALVTWVAIDGELGRLSTWQGCIAAGSAGILGGEAIIRQRQIRRKDKELDDRLEVIGWYAAETGVIWPGPAVG